MITAHFANGQRVSNHGHPEPEPRAFVESLARDVAQWGPIVRVTVLREVEVRPKEWEPGWD